MHCILYTTMMHCISVNGENSILEFNSKRGCVILSDQHWHKIKPLTTSMLFSINLLKMEVNGFCCSTYVLK